MVRALKARFPTLLIVGSAYSYLQEYLPHVAQAEVRAGRVDSVGLGRMLLAYPGLLADATRRGKLARRQICRTFSDCTTAPRNGLPSGCYPLDPYYKGSSNAARLEGLKALGAGRGV
jgi:NADPH2 dehydrogenase